MVPEWPLLEIYVSEQRLPPESKVHVVDRHSTSDGPGLEYVKDVLAVVVVDPRN